jgi:nicotinamide-nucleotide amidase
LKRFCDEIMYDELLTLLKNCQGRLATAESCTGGLAAAAITDIPGISEVYAGSVVAYENAVKMRLLEVPESVLIKHGAVSEECAYFMASGAAKALQSSYAVSTTGIAGPSGAVPGKPVGTVCIGYYLNGKVVTETNHFSGDRNEVRNQAVARAITHLIELLKSQVG